MCLNSVGSMKIFQLSSACGHSVKMHICTRGVHRQSSDDTSHEEQHLTAGDLRDLSNKPELSDLCYGFMHNMRGTIAYWQRTKMDLLAMFRTIDPPAFFITLTALMT